MTRGAQGSEPDGTVADVFYVLAMYATRQAGITATDLHAAIRREDGDDGAPSRTQVSRALQNLARRDPPLAVYAERWTVTDHGYRMLAAWVGDDDDPAPAGAELLLRARLDYAIRRDGILTPDEQLAVTLAAAALAPAPAGLPRQAPPLTGTNDDLFQLDGGAG